jgi:hypothetical protein
MLTNTYSDRVNIIKYVKLDEGWRFAPLAANRTGISAATPPPASVRKCRR